MFRGAYTDAGPQITALVRIGSAPRAEPFRVDFLIDTGTDRTMLARGDFADAGFDGSDLSGLPVSPASTAAGPVTLRLMPSVIWLFDWETEEHVPRAGLIDVPEIELAPGMPSLLGRDITDKYRLVIDKENGIVTLDDPEKYR